jgi:hypothetical protein
MYLSMVSRSSKKALIVLLFVIFGLLSLYFSYYLYLYYVQIFCVNRGVLGELVWCSGGPGAFFPFPRESGYEAVITRSYSLIDYLIYDLIISTSIIYILPFISWLITLFLAWELIRIIRSSSSTHIDSINQ